MINKTNCIVVLLNKETGKKEFLVICDIEGDKKNQAITIGMQLDEILANTKGQTGICDVELLVSGSPSSVANIAEAHGINCKPKIQAICPFDFTPRCMQVCYYLFVKEWRPQQIADLFKTSIPNIDGFKRLCFDEVGLADKDRTTAKLGVIWLLYYSDWIDFKVHKP